MSEAIANYSTQLGVIGTAVSIGMPDALEQYLREQLVDNATCGQSANQNQETYSEQGSCSTSQENRNSWTAYIHAKVPLHMDDKMGIVIYVHELVGSKFCVSYDDGEELHKYIVDALRDGKKAIISFKNVAEISSAFLESSIGKLYQGEFSDKEIADNVAIHDISEDDSFILKMVIDRAKDYFRDPGRFEAIMNEVLGENDD